MQRVHKFLVLLYSNAAKVTVVIVLFFKFKNENLHFTARKTKRHPINFLSFDR